MYTLAVIDLKLSRVSNPHSLQARTPDITFVLVSVMYLLVALAT